jgi:hypothetical protein
LKAGTGIEEDFWPELTEFTDSEKHVAPGYTNKDGSPAQLFSSDNANTVMRHFQWMEAYGIDGVAIQRFTVEMNAARHNHVLDYSVAAAEKTNRVLYVEYDMSGMKEADLVPALTKDWEILTQKGITSHPRWLWDIFPLLFLRQVCLIASFFPSHSRYLRKVCPPRRPARGRYFWLLHVPVQRSNSQRYSRHLPKRSEQSFCGRSGAMVLAH